MAINREIGEFIEKYVYYKVFPDVFYRNSAVTRDLDLNARLECLDPLLKTIAGLNISYINYLGQFCDIGVKISYITLIS